jgi:hypothetical protein
VFLCRDGVVGGFLFRVAPSKDTVNQTVQQSEGRGNVRDKRAKRHIRGASDRKEVVCAAGEAITRSPNKSAQRTDMAKLMGEFFQYFFVYGPKLELPCKNLLKFYILGFKKS